MSLCRSFPLLVIAIFNPEHSFFALAVQLLNPETISPTQKGHLSLKKKSKWLQCEGSQLAALALIFSQVVRLQPQIPPHHTSSPSSSLCSPVTSASFFFHPLFIFLICPLFCLHPSVVLSLSLFPLLLHDVNEKLDGF